ncbi:hypothetical protein Tco_0271811 [Tanacetum coccineum]
MANDDSKFPMQDMSHDPKPQYLKKSRKFTYKASAQSLKNQCLFNAKFHLLKDIKVKKSKNEQKPTRNEETSTRERFEANIKSRIKTVVEKSQESKEKDKGNDHYTL